MANLTQASRELFSRPPDERFKSIDALIERCRNDREKSRDRWQLPQTFRPHVHGERLGLALGDDGAFLMNDWSFTQLCQMAGIAKDTINRLSPDTACHALQETLPTADKPVQLLTGGQQIIRSIHGVSYTRLWNDDLLGMIKEAAAGFQPPPKGFNGATGLYAGEQDCFTFLIDPTGWTDIGGENFAPGFFCFNSEVGRRSVGITTFWYEEICQNHIVWNCADVVNVTRKHTRNVGDALTEIRMAIAQLVERRDAARDQFAAVVRKAMEATTGDKEETLAFLSKYDINRQLAKKAVELAESRGKRFTIWSMPSRNSRVTRSTPRPAQKQIRGPQHCWPSQRDFRYRTLRQPHAHKAWGLFR